MHPHAATCVVSMLAHRLRRWPNICGGPTFKQHWIIVGHVSYTVLAAWYCEAGQSTEGRSQLTDMADIVLYMIGIDASFISVFI